MAVHKHALGDYFYVNSTLATHPRSRAGVGPRYLVVHTHGDQTMVRAKVRVDVGLPINMDVLFQVTDWNYADDSDLRPFLTALARDGALPARAISETKNNGVMKDYRVYKFQSAGATGYGEVAALVNLNGGGAPVFDIVTARNRGKGCFSSATEVFLSQLILQLNAIQANHGYTHLYCSFCRVLRENDTYRPARDNFAMDL